MFKIILLACMLPVPVIIYFVLLNDTKPKKNLILGVTLPSEARQGEAVLSLCKRFKIVFRIVMLILLLLSIVLFFLQYDSVAVTYLMVWMLLVIVVPVIPYGYFNKRLKELKAANGWYSEASGVSLVDVKAAAMPKRLLSIWWFLPPVAISIIPLIYTIITLKSSDEFWWMFFIYAFLAAMVLLFYFLYRIIYHQKAEVVDENTDINIALTQVRIFNWGKYWIWSAWLTGIFNLLFWIFMYNTIAVIIISLVYTVVLVGVTLRVEFKARKIQQKLTENSGKSIYTDMDDNWIFGLIYYNPNDNHFMINNRTGIGTTVNLAKTSAKVLAVFIILLLAAMPFLGIWMMNEEFTSVRLAYSGNQVIALHTAQEYKIDIKDIQTISLIKELPTGTRTNGTAMTTVDKGNFRLQGIGACKICLDPQTPPFILIKTEKTTYILGSHDSNETLSIYKSLTDLGIG